MVNFTVSSKIITVVLKIIFWIVNLYVCIMEAIVIIQFQSLHTYTAMDALYYTNMIEWKGNKSKIQTCEHLHKTSIIQHNNNTPGVLEIRIH